LKSLKQGLLAALASLAIVVGLVKFASVANGHLPLQRWLIFEFLGVFALTFVFALTCLVVGHAFLRWLLGRVLPLGEQLTLGFALGVLTFYFFMSAGGFAKLYGPAWFFACPVLLVALGARASFRYARRLVRHLRYARARSRLRPNAFATLIAVAGALSIALLYLPILTPDHVGFDSAWYHVPIAEHYVADGGIRRFAEGWYLGSYPHLSSLLYCWALLAPKASFFFRLELAAHIEFVILLFTLAGIPALARRVSGRRTGLAWVACFLFPTIFFHDTALAADHVAALWAVPIHLALFRFLALPGPRVGALVGAMLAGAMLVKYTAFPMVVLPVAVVAFVTLRSLVLVARRPTQQAGVVGGVSAGATALFATAPHWLKNFVFYGDPLYPILHRHTTPRPWHQDASYLAEVYMTKVGTFPAERSLAGFLDTLHALFDFSFKAYEFYEYHRDVPYFGSLFTIASLALPFVRPTRRLLLLTASSYVTIFSWYWQSHVDRYLQAFLPLLATVVAVVFGAVWRNGWVGRVPVLAAVAFQIVWGAGMFGMPFLVDRYRVTLEVIGSTFRGDASFKERKFAGWRNIGAAVPPDGKLLVHDQFIHMGTERRTASDWIGLQGGINYGRMQSPRDVWTTFRQMGITHLAWTHNTLDSDSLAGDLRFFEFAELYTVDRRQIGGHFVARVPSQPPEDRRGDRVLILACSLERYKPGLHTLASTAIPHLHGKVDWPFPEPMQPLRPDNADELRSQARFVVTEAGCNTAAASAVPGAFRMVGIRMQRQLWVRDDRALSVQAR
jgi:hypothetical protein